MPFSQSSSDSQKRSLLLSTRYPKGALATSAPPEDFLRFKPSDRPTPFPAPVHAKNGCLAVTGTNLDSQAIWTQFKRTAFLGENGAGMPVGCIAVSTIGALVSVTGLLHFKGKGHYCPKTDKAVYHYVFDATEAERFGMPERGTIDYDGSKNIETYSGSMP